MSIQVNVAIAGDRSPDGMIAWLNEQEFAPAIGAAIYLPKGLVRAPERMGYYRVVDVVLHYGIQVVVANVLVAPISDPYGATVLPKEANA